MRILMLTHNIAGYGGSFVRSHSLARGLASLGHEVTLLAGTRRIRLFPRRAVEEGAVVAEMPDILPRRFRNSGLSPIDLAGRLVHGSLERYDVVHGFDHRPCVSLPALAHRFLHGAPYIADWADLWGLEGIGGERKTLAGKLLARLDHSLERKIHGMADGVTVISSYLENLVEELGVPPARIRRVPVGSNTDLIRPLPREEMRRRHGLPVEGRILVHIGFASSDAAFLGQAFAAYAGRDPGALLLLTGRRMPELERVIRASGLSGRVIRRGIVPYPELGELLACGDAMLLPYTDRIINLGRYPNKIGDYMAAGRAVVTHPTGDLGEMVREEGIGLLAGPTPGEFAEAIATLAENDALREDMERRARKIAETRYAWPILARECEAFYKAFLGAGNRLRPGENKRG